MLPDTDPVQLHVVHRKIIVPCTIIHSAFLCKLSANEQRKRDCRVSKNPQNLYRLPRHRSLDKPRVLRVRLSPEVGLLLGTPFCLQER